MGGGLDEPRVPPELGPAGACRRDRDQLEDPPRGGEKTSTRSASITASSMWCVTKRTVFGRRPSSWPSHSPSSSRFISSRAEKGSSISRSGGSWASALAMLTRWSIPPERWWGRLASWPPSPKSRRRSPAGKPARRAMRWVNRTSSTARFQGRTAGRCDTRPSRRCRRAAPAGSGPIQTSPVEGDSRSATMRSRVVLPQPDGPTRATNSPAPTSRSIRSSASVSPNRRETPRIEIGSTGSGYGRPAAVPRGAAGRPAGHPAAAAPVSA